MEEEINQLTREELLFLLNPLGNTDEVFDESTADLRNLLISDITDLYSYNFSDYIQSEDSIQTRSNSAMEKLRRREEDLYKKEKMLSEQENAINFRKKIIRKEMNNVYGNTPVAKKVPSSEYVRPPDPVRTERLIDPFPQMNHMHRMNDPSLDEVLHMSEQEYNLSNNNRMREEDELKLATERSLEEFNKLLESSIKIKEEQPNYSKLSEMHHGYTKTVVDEMFRLLKERNFDEFKKYVATCGMGVETTVWKNLIYNGSNLKQLVFSKSPDAYKVLL